MTTPEINPGWRIAWGGLGWLAGVALQMQQAALWPALHFGLLLAGAVPVLAVAAALRSRAAPATALLSTALISLALAAAGFASTGLRAGARLAERLDHRLEGQDLLLTGVIAAMPEVGPSGTRFRFEVESAQRAGMPVQVPGTLALGWYSGHRDEALLEDPRSDLRAGQRWRLPVRLKQPHGAMNPNGFDTELWLWEQGVRATGYVRVAQRGPAAEKLQDGVAHPVERARQWLRDAITRQVSDPRLAGVLAALLVGDQAAIERWVSTIKFYAGLTYEDASWRASP